MNIACKICKVEKRIEQFYKGHRQCKLCFRKKQKIYNIKNKDKIKKREKNKRLNPYFKEKISNYQKEYRNNNKEKLRLARQIWGENNREKDNNYKRKWRFKNKQKEYIYQKNRRNNNTNYKILGNLRHRIWCALEDNIKSKHTIDLLGCSIENFKIYLQDNFLEGMTWHNYGDNGWHIGHLLPCSLFNLSNPLEQQICFNYKNLKPQWEKDNLSQNDKLSNGKRARNLDSQEKIEYIKSLGYTL